MSFDKIIGHDNIVIFLRTAIKNDKLTHAYIFDGQDGVGRKLAAMEFAKAINCKKNIDNSCEKCSSCVKINNNNHPDMKIIEPDGKSIKNKQIEEFQNDILLKPYESNKKIFIIESADTMTTSAQNRILKILEEPPKYGVIILITQNSYSLLPTIRSRCQTLKFNRISKEKIKRYLIEKHGINEEESRILASFSDCSLGKALNLYGSEEFKNRREMVIDIISEIINGDKLKLLDFTSFFQDNKENINEILDFFTIWFRDMLLLIETSDEKYLFNSDKIIDLQRHTSNLDYEKIPKAVNIVEETRKNIDANVNFDLCIETMLLNLQEV
jgi:DNA polymerase-3 subunit delta'